MDEPTESNTPSVQSRDVFIGVNDVAVVADFATDDIVTIEYDGHLVESDQLAVRDLTAFAVGNDEEDCGENSQHAVDDAGLVIENEVDEVHGDEESLSITTMVTESE